MIPLILISIVEAVIYFLRYRASHKGGAAAEAMTTFAICALRVCFVYYGIKAFYSDLPLIVIILAYGTPAALATAVSRKIADR